MGTPDTTTEAHADTRPGSADDLPDYAPIPRPAFGPALNDQGYYVGRVERNLYWVTDGTYQSAFLTTSDGVVLLDAPPTIGHNIRRAVDEIAAANGVSNRVTYLIYSHHHADHAGASSLFDRNVVRIGHEETRRLLERDNDPARPLPDETFAGPAQPRHRRRAHRACLARLEPLAGQHLHPPARPRHADAGGHREPRLGARVPEQPDRGHPRLPRRARDRADLPVEALHRRPHGAARHARGHHAAPAVHGRHLGQLTESARHRRPDAVLRQVRREHMGRVRGYLDAVTAAAAEPVIERYTGVLAAADVFTASTTFHVMQSIRLDLGYGSQVHP